MSKKVKGSLNRPRLYVFKSNKHIYVQIIDDDNNKILMSGSTINQKFNYTNCEIAKKIGTDIASKLKNQGINQIIFDRGKNIYHGKIKALAEATRQSGIYF